VVDPGGDDPTRSRHPRDAGGDGAPRAQGRRADPHPSRPRRRRVAPLGRCGRTHRLRPPARARPLTTRRGGRSGSHGGRRLTLGSEVVEAVTPPGTAPGTRALARASPAARRRPGRGRRLVWVGLPDGDVSALPREPRARGGARAALHRAGHGRVRDGTAVLTRRARTASSARRARPVAGRGPKDLPALRTAVYPEALPAAPSTSPSGASSPTSQADARAARDARRRRRPVHAALRRRVELIEQSSAQRASAAARASGGGERAARWPRGGERVERRVRGRHPGTARSTTSGNLAGCAVASAIAGASSPGRGRARADARSPRGRWRCVGRRARPSSRQVRAMRASVASSSTTAPLSGHGPPRRRRARAGARSCSGRRRPWRWRPSRRWHAARTGRLAAQVAREVIVGVVGGHEAPDGHAHGGGEQPGDEVAEVAGGDAFTSPDAHVPQQALELQRGPRVVAGLRQQAAEVDRVGGREPERARARGRRARP
jgi:hypothetical protein